MRRLHCPGTRLRCRGGATCWRGGASRRLCSWVNAYVRERVHASQIVSAQLSLLSRLCSWGCYVRERALASQHNSFALSVSPSLSFCMHAPYAWQSPPWTKVWSNRSLSVRACACGCPNARVHVCVCACVCAYACACVGSLDVTFMPNQTMRDGAGAQIAVCVCVCGLAPVHTRVP